MPLIDLPDGNQLDFPDDATPEMRNALRQKLSTAYQTATPGQKLWDTVKDVGRNIQSGATDFVRGAGNALAGLAEGAGEFNAAERGPLRRSGDSGLTKVPEQVLPTPQGDSMPRQYLRAGLEGLGGALATGGTGAVNLISGVGSGLGGKTAEEWAPDNPLAKFAGNVVGGLSAALPAGMISRVRPQTAAVAKEAIEGLTPDQLNTAQQYKNGLAQKGIEIDLAQALQATNGHSGNLESIRNFLAGNSRGDKVQATLRGQPEALAREGELTVGNLPGTNYSATQNADNLQEAASAALKRATDSRSSTVKGLYAQAGDLPDSARNELGNILNKYATQPGATEVLKARAKELADKLLGNDPKLTQAVADARDALAAATSPSSRLAARQQLAAANGALQNAATKPLKALDVDTWISELRGPWQGQPLKVAYPRAQGQIKGLAGALNTKFQELSPEVANVEGVFQRITQDTVNPLKQGPIGALTQPRGYDPATAAMVSKFDGLMNKGTDPTAKVSDISTAAKELAKSDPSAFEDAFKGWLSRKVQSATTASGGGSALPTADPKLMARQVFDDPLQWQGIKDATAAMAKIRGVPPEEMIRGLENFRQITTAMGSRAPVGGISPNDLRELGGNSAIADAARMGGMMGNNQAGRFLERKTFGTTLSKLDEILTSPSGAELLIKLSKVPVMSNKAQWLIGTWGGGLANPPGLRSDNTPE